MTGVEVKSRRILLVTGMSGAGRSTALRAFADMGWETVDHLPLPLLNQLLETPLPGSADDNRPLALGFDSQTRGFEAEAVVAQLKRSSQAGEHAVSMLFLDCAGAELERRYAETRRRHPLSLDRPAADGIARERELMLPLRRWAQFLIDTSDCTTNALQEELRRLFAQEGQTRLAITLMSFGYARGIPRNADLVFDMRFLRNPYWDTELRHMTGQQADVAAYIEADSGYGPVMGQLSAMLTDMLPRYVDQGKYQVTVAFGCTGGRHRSVCVAEEMAKRLRNAGFSLTIIHRDMTSTAHVSADSWEQLDGSAEESQGEDSQNDGSFQRDRPAGEVR